MDTTSLDVGLGEAVCALTVSAQGLLTSIEELKRAVQHLPQSTVIAPHAHYENLDTSDRKNVEEETAWETVRNTIKDQDMEAVESWKDELNNLLVFTGLFSAVVTAFTVESYTWLQQDPEDASNMLLARLSLQLSQLAPAPLANSASSALSNSTAPALSLSDVQLSFSPGAYAVPVNTLWVLSLTLSLISAFFAITVQQWLRQLRLPPDMPVRRAVQLLATRSDGLKCWQVPSIISLLPLLLQIAVILFLAGLFLLLRSLNTAVTVAFGAVALLAAVAYLLTTVIPLVTIHCPYKSPVIPTILIALQCMSYPLVFLVTLAIIPLNALLQSRPASSIIGALDWSWLRSLRSHIWSLCIASLVPYIKSFGRHMFIDMGQFWLSREYQDIFTQDEYGTAGLERLSLIQVFLSIPSRSSSKISQLIQGFRGDMWPQAFQDTVVHSLRAFPTGVNLTNLLSSYQQDHKIVPYIRGWLAARHHRLLWQTLRQRDWTQDRTVTSDESQCLMLYHTLNQTSSAALQPYAKHLLRICASQQFSEHCFPRETVPICLLLDLIVNQGYVLETDDAAAILAFVPRVYAPDYRRVDDDVCRLLLVAPTLALHAVSAAGTTPSTDTMKTISVSAEHLDKTGTKVALHVMLQSYYQNPSPWLRAYPAFMLPAELLRALCEALADHAAMCMDTLSSYPSHLETLTRISVSLRHVCSDSVYSEKLEIQEARKHLGDLDGRTAGIVELVSATKTVASEPATKAADFANVSVPEGMRGDGDHNAVLATSEAGPDATPVSIVAILNGAAVDGHMHTQPFASGATAGPVWSVQPGGASHIEAADPEDERGGLYRTTGSRIYEANEDPDTSSALAVAAGTFSDSPEPETVSPGPRRHNLVRRNALGRPAKGPAA